MCVWSVNLCVLSLTRSENRWQETPLMLAAAAGNRQSVAALITAGADVALTDQWGSTALRMSRMT